MANLANANALPVKATNTEKYVVRCSVAIGAAGAPTVSGDSDVSLTRTGAGTYTVSYPACAAVSILPSVGKSSTLTSVRCSAKSATAGTATLETLATATATDGANGDVIELVIVGQPYGS